MIKVEGLVKSYGNHEVLKNINFEVKSNEIYGFLGHNGAGKSTTINILASLIKPIRGKVLVEGSIGYLPEDPKFYPYMTAKEYLQLIGEISGFHKSDILKRSDEILERVKLSKDAKRKIGGYSRGMKQRLGFAVALFNRPQLLLLDEPASALDPEGRREMLELIQQFKEQGGTVFLSSHILNDLERIADRIGILNKGEILLEGSLEKIKGKYLLPIYDIEFENTCGMLPQKLRDENWVEEIQIKGSSISIGVKNPEIAKMKLMEMLVENNQPVISYQIRKSSLEDIYIRVVGKNE